LKHCPKKSHTKSKTFLAILILKVGMFSEWNKKSPNNPTCRNKMLILCRLSVALWRNWPKKGKNNYNFKIDFRKSSRYFWGKIWAWLQPQTPKA